MDPAEHDLGGVYHRLAEKACRGSSGSKQANSRDTGSSGVKLEGSNSSISSGDGKRDRSKEPYIDIHGILITPISDGGGGCGDDKSSSSSSSSEISLSPKQPFSQSSSQYEDYMGGGGGSKRAKALFAASQNAPSASTVSSR